MANEQPAAPVDGASEAPAKTKLPLLIGLVAVGLAVGGGTGALFLGPMVAKKMGKVTPIVADSAHAGGEAESDGEHAAAGEGGKEGGAAEAAIHVLDNMVLNPAGSGGSRYLLLTVAIEVGTPAAVESFKARDAELRDIVLSTLGTKPVDQLTDMSARETFKTEIISAVDARFGKKSVKRIYFPQFVVQ